MKTICAALGMAVLLTFSASADTLTLPKGHVLDLEILSIFLTGDRHTLESR